MTDYWAHRYYEDPKLMDEVEDEGFDADEIMAQWEAEAAEDAADGTAVDTVSTEKLADPDDWETL